MPGTAPLPLLRLERESSLHRIGVHVVQLLHLLLFCEHDEIVKSRLPDVAMVESCLPEPILTHVGCRSQFAQEAASEALFDGLHDFGWIAPLRFAEQQVDVLGHDHVTNYHEMVSPAYALQDMKQQVAILCSCEQRQSLITTGGNEMEISRTVVAMELVGHEAQLAQDVKSCM